MGFKSKQIGLGYLIRKEKLLDPRDLRLLTGHGVLKISKKLVPLSVVLNSIDTNPSLISVYLIRNNITCIVTLENFPIELFKT